MFKFISYLDVVLEMVIMILGLFFPYFTELYFCETMDSILYGEVDSPFCDSSTSESSFDVGPINANFHYFQNIFL